MIEYFFGIIPLKREKGHWETLIVKHQKEHWDFPKGHAASGENSIHTAERELKKRQACIGVIISLFVLNLKSINTAILNKSL
jgi:ADP-ribose pyrophosphatase YjhB (NUDIX family)